MMDAPLATHITAATMRVARSPLDRLVFGDGRFDPAASHDGAHHRSTGWVSSRNRVKIGGGTASMSNLVHTEAAAITAVAADENFCGQADERW